MAKNSAFLVAFALVLTAACGKASGPAASPPAAPEPPPAAPLPQAASPTAALPVAATPAAANMAKPVELSAKSAHFAATWHFAAPKVGELFAVDIALTDLAGQPLAAPKVAIDATMPAHGHGMMTDPELRQTAPTKWHADGLKLHMHGSWQFDVRVEAAGVKERLSAAYEEPPEAADGL